MIQTNLYEEANRRLQELNVIMHAKEKELKKMPEGTIHVVNSAGRIQYYLRSNQFKDKYLSIKKEKKTIQLLLQKKYDKKILKQIEKEIVALTNLISMVSNSDDIIKNIYSNNPLKIKQFINPIDCSIEDYRAYWLSIPYQGKKIPDTVPVYLTDRGERVRSKSELNIANALLKHGVPYKYECPLELNGITIYPDFTVLQEKARTEIYWEHRGMMDDRDYARHTVAKIKEYEKNGYFLGKKLVITEETSQYPLGTNEIIKLIQCYFL